MLKPELRADLSSGSPVNEGRLALAPGCAEAGVGMVSAIRAATVRAARRMSRLWDRIRRSDGPGYFGAQVGDVVRIEGADDVPLADALAAWLGVAGDPRAEGAIGVAHR